MVVLACESLQYFIEYERHLVVLACESLQYFTEYERHLVVLACESLHVCTMCVSGAVNTQVFCEGFSAPYRNFHSFIHAYKKIFP